jgi:hypothetical protein
MRIGWGYRITFVYLLFVCGILFLVLQSSRQRVDLVSDEYYEEEVRYQQRIDESRRADALSEKPKLQLAENSISVLLPAEFEGRQAAVKAHLYCPADSRRDIILETATDRRSLRLDWKGQRRGLHILKLNWSADGVSYYSEENIFIP